MAELWEATLLYAPRSFRITIPKEIVKGNGWKKGERLSISRDNGTIRVEARKKPEKEKVTSVFSIGYEGKKIENFVKLLKDHDVKQLLDVRMNAFSFKVGFSKTPLANALHKESIMYMHIPQLGTDQETRKEYKETGDISKLIDLFAKKLESNIDYYELLKASVLYKPSAIMCFEDDHTKCHRSIIENRLKADDISVVQLCNGKQNEFF